MLRTRDEIRRLCNKDRDLGPKGIGVIGMANAELQPKICCLKLQMEKLYDH